MGSLLQGYGAWLGVEEWEESWGDPALAECAEVGSGWCTNGPAFDFGSAAHDRRFEGCSGLL
jgi:hypothetical protein